MYLLFLFYLEILNLFHYIGSLCNFFECPIKFDIFPEVSNTFLQTLHIGFPLVFFSKYFQTSDLYLDII